MKTVPSLRAYVRAFTLLEVLVAVFITAIGFLGVAALQAQSLLSGQEGFLRAQATLYAEDYAARIRASREAASTLSINAFLASYAGTPIICAAPLTFSCSGNANCTPAGLIAFDRAETCQNINTALPDGELRAIQTGARLSIGVGWSVAAAATGRGAQDAINRDSQCAQLGFADGFNCVVLELVP